MGPINSHFTAFLQADRSEYTVGSLENRQHVRVCDLSLEPFHLGKIALNKLLHTYHPTKQRLCALHK